MSKKEKQRSQKIEAARLYLSGRGSAQTIALKYGVDRNTVLRWARAYKEYGENGLHQNYRPRYIEKNPIYSEELKMAAVESYLKGEGSLKNVCKRYGIRSNHALENWIKVYNSGRDFGRKMSGGSRMKQGRETTQEERIGIAKDCLENGSNYGETAIKYNVSYQQVYTWVKKFRELGEAGLEDRRGKKTISQEPRTELEELKIKMAQLEHELYMTRMERDLLKKLDELERRDAFRK